MIYLCLGALWFTYVWEHYDLPMFGSTMIYLCLGQLWFTCVWEHYDLPVFGTTMHLPVFGSTMHLPLFENTKSSCGDWCKYLASHTVESLLSEDAGTKGCSVTEMFGRVEQYYLYTKHDTFHLMHSKSIYEYHYFRSSDNWRFGSLNTSLPLYLVSNLCP